MERGIAYGWFRDCDVAGAGTLVPALCDGLGVRLVRGGPRVDLATARATIWRTTAPVEA
ncbi:hypothetical protein ACFW7J_37855 [Streptomyces sp. NPDC059525]|uniref:hypothetical protein n=1 Tax=Streptomyces sp. NPDC059525 TaxID=3346857 RepID=UPI00368DBFB5